MASEGRKREGVRATVPQTLAGRCQVAKAPELFWRCWWCVLSRQGESVAGGWRARRAHGSPVDGATLPLRHRDDHSVLAVLRTKTK